MKHYIDQLNELEIATARYNTLINKKKMYELQVKPKSPKMDKILTTGGIVEDKFLNYAIKIEEIDNELETLTEEIANIKENLKKMQNAIKNMDSLEYQIFKLHEIDRLNIHQIQVRTGYSQTHIYRILKKITKW